MVNIYLVGNPLMEEDSMPLKLSTELKSSFPNYKFIEFDPTEEIPHENNLIIIDTIINSNEIKILKNPDFDKFENAPNYSLHDFDLAMSLKLAKKLGNIKNVIIIGLPPGGDIKKIGQDLKKALKSIIKK